jgi:RimJ/RimL family protein N-acetyltransferase
VKGQVVTVEPLALDHEGALFAAGRPEEIWEWWPFNPARDREAFRAWMVEALAAVADGREIRFAILDSAGEPIGATSYCDLRPEERAVEIGWTWLTPRAWGSGANSDAKLLLLRHAFEVLGCRRVEFHTDALNSRSRAALAALPSHLDGVLRDFKPMPGGGWRSNAVYSILADEWPRTEEALNARIERQRSFRGLGGSDGRC